MDKLHLTDDVNVMGIQVKTFPDRIGEAFDILIQQLPDGLHRGYYGLSFCEGDQIIYWALAEMKASDEAAHYQLQPFTIEKGLYHTVTITNWRTKTDIVKDVFHTMMEELNCGSGVQCIEWYKTDDELLCMIKQ